MASRMDRYSKSELVTKDRSMKNKSLYEQIQDLDTYSNIEGVASIEKSNEIDISMVKELLKNREDYKKRKHLNDLNGLSKEEKIETNIKEEKIEDSKNYDINSIFTKIKDNNSDNKFRSLDAEQYKELKNLKSKPKKLTIEEEENEIKELINTVNITRTLKNSQEDDVGLFEDLKSDTMVGDAASIKKIIEEEKEKTKLNIDEIDEIDKSFYTSSFGFTQRDFEELKDINHKIKKGNKFIIILLVILISLLIIGISMFLIFR